MFSGTPLYNYVLGQAIHWFRRRPMPPKRINQEEPIPEVGPWTFRQRLIKAKYVGPVPSYITCVYITQDVMNEPYSVNNTDITYERAALEEWLSKQKEIWLNKMKQEWEEKASTEKDNESYEEWLKQQKYLAIIPTDTDDTEFKSMAPNKQREALIELFVDAVEKMAATKVNYEKLTLEKYLTLFRDAKTAYNHQTIPYFLETKLTEPLTDFSELAADLISAFILIPPLQHFIVTTKSIIDIGSKSKAMEARLKEENEVLGKDRHHMQVIEKVTSIEFFLQYTKLVNILAEACLPHSLPNSARETFSEFKLRLSSELAARNKLIENLQKLIQYINTNQLPEWLFDNRAQLLKELNTSLLKHTNSNRRLDLQAFLSQAEKLTEPPVVYEKLGLEKYASLFIAEQISEGFKNIPLTNQLENAHVTTENFLSCFILVPHLSQLIDTAKPIAIKEELALLETEQLKIIIKTTDIDFFRRYFVGLKHLAEACLPNHISAEQCAETFLDFKTRLRQELELRTNLIVSLRKLIDYMTAHVLPEWLESDKPELLLELQSCLTLHEHSVRKRMTHDFLMLVEEIPFIQGKLEQVISQAKENIREIDAKIATIQNEKNSAQQIFLLLKLQNTNVTKEGLKKIFEAQRQQTIERMAAETFQLVDTLHSFLECTDAIIKAENPHVNPTKEVRREMCSLIESVYLEILPADAKTTYAPAKSACLMEKLKSLPLFKTNIPSMNVAGVNCHLSSPLFFFNLFSLRNNTLMIEYHPGLVQQREAEQKMVKKP